MDKKDVKATGQCPVMHGAQMLAAFGVRSNRDWWPNQLNLKMLHQHSALSSPMGQGLRLCRGIQVARSQGR